MFEVPTRCTLCEGAVQVERVRCERCSSALEGVFALGWPGSLSREQLGFVEVFLRSRGKIKDVEQALGLSYPTVVARLDEVVSALGPPGPGPRGRSRHAVLDELAAGTIDVDEAERRLRGC